MNKFSDMSTFVAVVEAASFSEAGRRLGTTKSLISQRMQQLEKRLGCVLLTRARPLRLTEAGQQFYADSLRILLELERAETSVQDNQASLNGTLRIAAPMAFTPRYLAPLLARFALRYPQLCVDTEAQDKLASLQDGHFDVAIRLGALNDSCLVARPLTENRHLICASPDYLARHGTPEHPGDLQQHDGLIYYNREPNGMWSLPLDGAQHSFRIRVRMRTDSGHQLLEGARAGLGLAILPSFLAAEALLDGSLVSVLADYAPSGGQISAVYRKTLRTPPKVLTLIEFLSEEISRPAPWDAALIARGLIAAPANA
ncbi:LysR family transcriptional regulator [Pseudomonas chlororaphis]|uniref:LysR family transcriptional regulator n=1 Tax=Pseudomonas chlororaphis TaxID=587753 RepID=A0A1Q8EQ58_9PSED|nr:LysR family transcriptional regulator [Pseudomonas chlororaphis]OLF53928.1 LysR family transcriptional regulator [Pseudomonas chlororaphis]